jgi:hypothetical protein
MVQARSMTGANVAFAVVLFTGSPALANDAPTLLTLPSAANGQVETTSGPSGSAAPFTSSYGGSVILNTGSSGAIPLGGNTGGLLGPNDTAAATVSVSPAIDNGYLFASTVINAPTQQLLPAGAGVGDLTYPIFEYQAGATASAYGTLEYQLIVNGSTPTVAVQIKADASLRGSPTLAARENLSAAFSIANVLNDSVSINYGPGGSTTTIGAGYVSTPAPYIDAEGIPEYSVAGGITEDGVYTLNTDQRYNVSESILLTDSITTSTSENRFSNGVIVLGGGVIDSISLDPSFAIVAPDPSQYTIVLSPGVGASGAVPEASTWAMMLIGFAGLGFMGWRSRKTIAVA